MSSDELIMLLLFLVCVCLAAFIVLAPVAFGMIMRVLYRRRAQYAAAPHTLKTCCVCGTLQEPKRLKQCMECGGWFCSYPPRKSPRKQWDETLGTTALILGFILTAISVGGALILCTPIAIPIAIAYLTFRSSLPSGSCGGSVYGPPNATYRTQLLGERCNNCGGAITARHPLPPSKNNDLDYDRDYYRGDPSDISDRYHRDDDDDDGSFWDGWLIKWSS